METTIINYSNLDNLFLFRIKPKLMFDPIPGASMMLDNNNQEDFTDFTILSQEGTRFPCHRLVVASQSPPMKAMMTRDTKEKKEGQVQLQFKEEVVKDFVGYFYSRKIFRRSSRRTWRTSSPSLTPMTWPNSSSRLKRPP